MSWYNHFKRPALEIFALKLTGSLAYFRRNLYSRPQAVKAAAYEGLVRYRYNLFICLSALTYAFADILVGLCCCFSKIV